MTVRFIKGSGNRLVIGKIAGIERLTKRGMRQAMFRVGQGLVQQASTEIIRKPKSGRTYKIRTRSGRRRRHVASAPGETHANLTGAARRSLSFQLHGTSQIEFGYGASAGTDAPDYVGFLEFGTRKMKARPSLQNAIRAEEARIVQHFEREIRKQFK